MADEQIDLFEFSLSKLVIRHLEPHFLKQRKKVTQVYSLKRLGHECSVLISSLACTAGSDDETIKTAYEAGAARLASVTELNQLPATECGLQELDQALVALVKVGPKLKRQLVEAARPPYRLMATCKYRKPSCSGPSPTLSTALCRR